MNKKRLDIIIIIAVIIIIAIIGIGIHRAKAPETSNNYTASGTIPSGITASSSMGVSINIGKFYSNGSFSFTYPTLWNIEQYSPFSMTNFNGKYLAGNIIPADGAEIDIVTTTVQNGYLPDIMTTQLMSAVNITTTTLTVDNVACPAAAYEANYAPGITSKDVSVYCPRGAELWELYLSYEASDTPLETSRHVADFNSVLASMKFLP